MGVGVRERPFGCVGGCVGVWVCVDVGVRGVSAWVWIWVGKAVCGCVWVDACV